MGEFYLEEAVELYGRKLFRYIYTLLGDYCEAEDIVQDTFIAAYCGQASFDGEDTAAWLYKIAYNKSIDRLRRHNVISFQELCRDIPASGQEPDCGYSPAVIRGLKRLTDRERLVLLGRINGCLSYGELSDQLDMPYSALRKCCERAKRKLSAYIRETEREGVL